MEKEPIDDEKKIKWDNRNEEARQIIKMSISHDLRFHLQKIDDLDEAWEKLEYVFGKYNIIWAHQLENQILTLITIFFLALKTIYLSLKHLEINVKNVR